MKHLSLKLRLTILHTLVMSIVVAIVLGLLLSISSREVLSNVQNDLERRVNESYEDISVLGNELIFDSDFFEIQDGVYLSSYNEDSLSLLYGRIPYGFEYELPFEEGKIREVKSGENNYYVYDSLVPIKGYANIVIRGIVSYNDAEKEFETTIKTALILFPLLVALTAVAGYLLSRRALRPVSKITKTVKEIREKEDLSRRVDLGDGKDEIYTLAHTFDELLKDVEKSVEREKRFTSDVAHELRTPLAVSKMAIEDALDKATDEKILEDLSILKNKNEMMTKMVSELLLLSRADQGRITLSKERLDISSLVEMLALEFKELAKAKEIEVEYEIEDGIYLEIDETLFIRMIDNVIENAIKYSFENSKIKIILKRKDDTIILSVQDEGIGIKEENLTRIFDRFYQEDESRNEKSAGLGLSIVKWIAQKHDAEIKVQSTPNKGTTFTFIFKAEACGSLD